tara:strand:+ start:267 stop:1031 length:765 start_codon:yes stop_codon:yes gene_type:complete
MIDTDTLKAQVYFGLKQNSLSAENWETVICEAMSATWIEGDKYLADGVLNNHILNIKTLRFKPSIKKKIKNRDFISDPFSSEFDPTNQMMIQRRTNLPVKLDEQRSTPLEIGTATLTGFENFVQESYDKFPGTNNVLDVVVRHGIDRTQTRYLVDVDIFDHHFYNPAKMVWTEVFGGSKSRQASKRIAVEGFMNNKLVARRNGSNSGLYQTNYLIYKDLTKSTHNFTISIPIPSLLAFDKDAVLKEIQQQEDML